MGEEESWYETRIKKAHDQGYPYFDPWEREYICNKCGEPWEGYGIRHGDMTKAEAKKFWAGEGCPCCPNKK